MDAATRILSPSEISCFRDCRQKWIYSYIDRLPRSRSGPSRRIGTIVHAGLAAWYNKESLDACFGTLKHVGKKQEALAEEIEKATAIFENYIVHYADDLERYVPEIIEIKITNKHVGLKAIPDILWKDLETDKKIVVDHKVVQSLEIDKTFDTQKIALYKVMNDLYGIDGILYNLVKSSLPLIPEPLKNKTRLKKFAPASTTEKIFNKALKDGGFDKKDYPDAIKFFKENDNPFYKRVFVSISREELNEFDTEVAIVRDQMASGIIYRNRQWDCERGCDYYDICFKPDSSSEKILQGGE